MRGGAGIASSKKERSGTRTAENAEVRKMENGNGEWRWGMDGMYMGDGDGIDLVSYLPKRASFVG